VVAAAVLDTTQPQVMAARQALVPIALQQADMEQTETLVILAATEEQGTVAKLV
jgi:hypothetical protein